MHFVVQGAGACGKDGWVVEAVGTAGEVMLGVEGSAILLKYGVGKGLTAAIIVTRAVEKLL